MFVWAPMRVTCIYVFRTKFFQQSSNISRLPGRSRVLSIAKFTHITHDDYLVNTRYSCHDKEIIIFNNQRYSIRDEIVMYTVIKRFFSLLIKSNFYMALFDFRVQCLSSRCQRMSENVLINWCHCHSRSSKIRFYKQRYYY